MFENTNRWSCRYSSTKDNRCFSSVLSILEAIISTGTFLDIVGIMPNHRHKKQAPVSNGKRRGSGEENDESKNQQSTEPHANGAGAEGQQRHVRENDHVRGAQRDIENRDPQGQQGQGSMVKCCLPTGCEVCEMITVNDPHDAVRVICNNEQCDQSDWMHKECFDMWEDVVLAYLRSCGRARSWSEKQRLQNLWTKKGYDLAFKACDCKCGRGHLRKDLDYIPKANTKRRNKKKSTNDKPMPVINTGKHEKTHHANGNGSGNANGGGIMAVMINNINTNGIGVHPNVKRHMSGPLPPTHATPSNVQPHQRVRHLSLTSTGSSPPNSLGSPATVTPPSTPCTPNVGGSKKSKFDFFADASQAAAGNIFKRRPDFMSFSILPRHKQNPYHIKMEDDGPHGNDDTRSFILSHLSSYKATNISCLLCKTRMSVFDRYPLIDGTFFLSPVMYDQTSAYRVQMDGKTQYLQAVCMRCLEGGVILRCGACGRRWDGSTLLLGTMYSYDIFAATPCCQKRLSCKHCQIPIIICGLQFYSEYSHALPCPSCKIEDHHFVKPLQEVYIIQQPNICK